MRTVQAGPTPADLEALVDQVWTTCLAGAEGPLPAPPVDWSVRTALWSGAVSVTGDWPGMAVVDVHHDAAEALARAMLGLGPDAEPDPADLTDAIGELANIVGGNVKSLMPGASALSLPVVARSVLNPPADMLLEVCLDLAWHGSPLRVRVLTQTTPPTRTRHPQEVSP